MKQSIALLCAAWTLAACTSFDPPDIHLDRADLAQRAFVERA